MIEQTEFPFQEITTNTRKENACLFLIIAVVLIITTIVIVSVKKAKCSRDILTANQ